MKISMISLLSSLSLKLYSNSLVYHRQSSDIFGNFREMFGNVRVAFGNILENLRKVVGNLRKVIKNAVITDFYIIKRTLHVSSKI